MRMIELIAHTCSRQSGEQLCVLPTVTDAVDLARPHGPYCSVELILGAWLPPDEAIILAGLEHLRCDILGHTTQKATVRLDIEVVVSGYSGNRGWLRSHRVMITGLTWSCYRMAQPERQRRCPSFGRKRPPRIRRLCAGCRNVQDEPTCSHADAESAASPPADEIGQALANTSPRHVRQAKLRPVIAQD